MKKPFPLLLIVLLSCLIMMSGCGSGGGSSDKNPANSNNKPSNSSSFIYGIASKGPIKNGFVVVYALDASGNWDENKSLGVPTFTKDDGSYVVDIEGYSGNLLVKVKAGGTYKDEATGHEMTSGTLRAAVTRVRGDAVVMITPYTEIAVQRALNEGGLTEVNIDNANAFVGTVAGGVDIINTRPANVLNEDEIADSMPEEISYGLTLASISQMVNNNYAANVSDAINKISSAPGAQGEILNDSLKSFLVNQYNLSGITDPLQTEIDESFALLSNTSPEQDSRDINQVFRLLEGLYAQAAPSADDENMQAWFGNNIADDYLHDGRIKDDEISVWTGAGGLYHGESLSVVLMSPMDVGEQFEKGYRVRITFSGSKGTGSVISSMVYDGTNWLWYGNREWGVGLSNFLPRAEMVVEATGDVSFSNGFDVVIWDYNLSAYNHGIRSAIVTGPGFPEEEIG